MVSLTRFAPVRFVLVLSSLALLSLVFLTFFATGCGGPDLPGTVGRVFQVSTELAPEQVLHRQIAGDPPTLDPSLSTDVSTAHILDDLFEGLVSVAQDGSNTPGVASSWEQASDGKTWTFHLRSEARWSNGEAVTAKDFVYAWQRQVDPATGSQYAEALAPIENAEQITNGKLPLQKLGVEARDPHTLVVHLTAPTPYFVSLLSNAFMYPLYEPAVKQWGISWTQPGHLVSNGPFELTERVLNGQLALRKNSHYWDAKDVKLSEVLFYPIDDREAAQSQFLAGGLDFTDVMQTSQIDWLRRTLGDQVVMAPYFGTAMFSYNVTKPPFANNLKLRQALTIALDREILAKYVSHGTVEAAYNLMPPLPGYEPATPEWAKLSDKDRHALAKRLYREAGYSDSHPLETTLTYASGGAQTRRYMEAMAAMWEENLGAHVEIYNLEWKVLLQSVQMKEPVLFWNAWIGDYPDPLTFMSLFQANSGQNKTGYDSKPFDSLVDQASVTTNEARHFELFRQAEDILNKDAIYLPLYYYKSTHLIRPYVKGWTSNVMDRNLSRYMYVLAHQESAH